MELVEIYVLCRDRSKSLIFEFLNRFLPNRKELSEDYPYPEYADDPIYVFDNSEKIIEKLEQDKYESYSLYWGNTDGGEVNSAMIFFTKDGGMIAGITVADGEEVSWFEKLSRLLGGEYGYVSFDQPPPERTSEFINFCIRTDQKRMISGKYFCS